MTSIYIYNKRSGAEVACLAHNQEDTGSKPVFAKFFFYLFTKYNLFKMYLIYYLIKNNEYSFTK